MDAHLQYKAQTGIHFLRIPGGIFANKQLNFAENLHYTVFVSIFTFHTAENAQKITEKSNIFLKFFANYRPLKHQKDLGNMHSNSELQAIITGLAPQAFS